MLTLIHKFPYPFLVIMLLLLAVGTFEVSQAAGFGLLGYIIGFAIALGFFLVYWVTYGRYAGSAFRAVLPLMAIVLLAAPVHLLGVGGIVPLMLVYTLVPGIGILLVVWTLSGRPLRS